LRCGGAIAAAALAAICLGCSNGLEAFAPARGAQPPLPPAELEGVIFEGYRGEQRELFVTSEKATVDLVARVATLERVTLRFSESERGRIEVAAPAGELKLDEDDFLLSGGVVGSAQAGESFSTESVRYIAASRELVSSTPVELRRTNLLLRANGMKLGLDARRLRLVGQVHARVLQP
jgi:LPS export ABC transporter protein LptC